MKVFMSWSGLRSKLTAELLHDWVKCVIQAAQPWISSKGIERGALWFSEINNELKDTAVGIICLTQENKNAPWILFESGALAKGLSTNRVCTFLIDLQAQDLLPPLAQFNHTFPNKDSLWSLVTTLNNGLETSRLDLQVLHRVFETYWPQFESSFAQILEQNPPITVVEPREEKDILAEILETTRSMSNRVRALEQRNSQLSLSDFDRHFKDTNTSHSRKFPKRVLGPAPDDSVQASISMALQLAKDLLKLDVGPDMIRKELVSSFGLNENQATLIIEDAYRKNDKTD